MHRTAAPGRALSCLLLRARLAGLLLLALLGRADLKVGRALLAAVTALAVTIARWRNVNRRYLKHIDSYWYRNSYYH